MSRFRRRQNSEHAGGAEETDPLAVSRGKTLGSSPRRLGGGFLVLIHPTNQSLLKR
jgi:hypothetical protein